MTARPRCHPTTARRISYVGAKRAFRLEPGNSVRRPCDRSHVLPQRPVTATPRVPDGKLSMVQYGHSNHGLVTACAFIYRVPRIPRRSVADMVNPEREPSGHSQDWCLDFVDTQIGESASHAPPSTKGTKFPQIYCIPVVRTGNVVE